MSLLEAFTASGVLEPYEEDWLTLRAAARSLLRGLFSVIFTKAQSVLSSSLERVAVGVDIVSG